MRRTELAIVAAVIAVPTWASGPCENIGDCADWVVVTAGVTCSEVVPWPCEDGSGRGRAVCDSGSGSAADNEGGVISYRRRIPISDGGQGCGGTAGFRTEIVRWTEGAEEVIAYVDDRCDNCAGTGRKQAVPRGLTFDEENGRLYFAFHSTCQGVSSVCGGAPSDQTTSAGRLIRFDSFTTQLEILQSYTPPSGPISFLVPYTPEGFQFADWFDTYYGDLATVGDWSQLHPLQCSYPASPPSVGDYLTVADPLATPSPGHGRYYVTAVNYQGERRYGRKRTGGVTSGRDLALLPPCVEWAQSENRQ